GKTTLALQVALKAAEKGARVIFLYTKPIFPLQKLHDLSFKFKALNALDNLNDILFMKVQTFEELCDLILKLEFQILSDKETHKNKSPVFILDSLTDLMRLEWNPQIKKKNFQIYYQLNRTLATLSHLNREYNMLIVVINEVSKIQQDNITLEAQSGGKVVEYWIPFTIHLKRMKTLKKRILLLKNQKFSQENELIVELTKQGFI
ncbi:MAG: hypothetical protein ACTSYC_02195, partial [Promethearchaeota archaeon]